MIRNSVKALLLRGDEILVNRCRDEHSGAVYYDLPGGGQRQYEPMESALLREILEETGLSAEIIRFAAIAEEIYCDDAVRRDYPDYSHRVSLIFLARVTAEPTVSPTELDYQQETSEWVSLAEADTLSFLPLQLNGRISRLVTSETPLYLGASFIG